MSRVKGRYTGPERVVRRIAHAMGLRFRLHRSDLPGRPDLVFPKWKTAIFVHGCFWHRHEHCRRASTPKSNLEFWEVKFARNVERDRKAEEDLRRLGWKVEIVWECATRNVDALEQRLSEIFTSPTT